MGLENTKLVTGEARGPYSQAAFSQLADLISYKKPHKPKSKHRQPGTLSSFSKYGP
jgi:hypothetical protein